MIKITNLKTNKEMEIPSEWDEISENQFIKLSGLLYLLNTGEIDVQTLQIRLCLIFMEFKWNFRYYFNATKEQVTENIALISDQLKFMFTIKDNLLNLHVKINQWLLSTIKIKNKTYNAAKFKINSNGIFLTDITTAQFIDMLNVFSLYSKNNDIKTLDILTSIFFYDKSHEYDSNKAIESANIFKYIDISIKYACYIKFIGFMEIIKNNTEYGIFWENTTNKQDSFNLGFSETVFSLSKKGYGTKSDVEKMNVMDFFAIILKETIDSVIELHGYGKSITEIQETTNLPLNFIEKCLS